MDVIDITLLGSGIASTLTLVEVLDRLLAAGGGLSGEPGGGRAGKTAIAVVEKHPEFFKGIPYGSRSSVNALTITSVHDFIYEQERPLFFGWLKAGVADWAPKYRERGGITAERWLERNLPLIENEDWETVYIPRFLFGNYLQEKLDRLLKAAEAAGLAEVRLIRAEAVDVKVTPDGLHEITLEHPDSTLSVITSRKLVISTGSAPVRKMCEISPGDAVYINDIYEPSVNENIKTLQAALAQSGTPDDRNMLIIGSNASSIELLYLLEGMPRLRELINKVVIISSSGLLPYHISTEALAAHPIPHLDQLRENGPYTIQALTDAAALDITLAVRDGANMDYVATVISNTLRLMEALDEDAKKAFYAIHAIRLRDMFRRSGPEYKNASQLLIDQQEVTIIKGRFLHTSPSTSPSEKGVLVHYTDAATVERQTYPLVFRAVVNCSGSDNLDQSSSRLLYNLVHKQICQMNLSGKGFEVNEKFEAAPGLYVMGPLLGGNVNKLIHFWQLENASRLTSLAPHLAAELLNF